MNRIYCLDCKKFFSKVKQGYTVPISNDQRVFVRGDLYRCSGCDKVVYGDFGEPFEVGKK